MFQRQKCRTPVSNANMTLLSDKIGSRDGAVVRALGSKSRPTQGKPIREPDIAHVTKINQCGPGSNHGDLAS